MGPGDGSNEEELEALIESILIILCVLGFLIFGGYLQARFGFIRVDLLQLDDAPPYQYEVLLDNGVKFVWESKSPIQDIFNIKDGIRRPRKERKNT